MTWSKDLAMGEKYQRQFLDIVEHDSYEMPKGCFKPYDIRITNKSDTFTVEVKSDRYAKRTGCIVIEFECNAKPSGITTTEADYWAYFIDGTQDYFLIPTDRIRKAIEEKQYTRTVRGGDGMRAHLYIFPGSIFADFRDSY